MHRHGGDGWKPRSRFWPSGQGLAPYPSWFWLVDGTMYVAATGYLTSPARGEGTGSKPSQFESLTRLHCENHDRSGRAASPDAIFGPPGAPVESHHPNLRQASKTGNDELRGNELTICR